MLDNLIASNQPQDCDEAANFAALSANLSNETWNELSEDDPFGEDYVLVGIERTVSKMD